MSVKPVILVLSAIFLQGHAQVDLFEGSGLPKSLTVNQWTVVTDPTDQPMSAINLTVSVWGEYQPFQDRMVLVDFVTDKIAYIEMHPEEFMLDQNTPESNLPLQGLLSATQVIEAGSQANRTLGLKLDVKIYAGDSSHTSTTLKTVSTTLKQSNSF